VGVRRGRRRQRGTTKITGDFRQIAERPIARFAGARKVFTLAYYLEEQRLLIDACEAIQSSRSDRERPRVRSRQEFL
jgi:hypothetical protein